MVETATLTTVSILTNLVALGVFSLIRMALPEHTPDVQRLMLEGKEYAAARTGYLFGWGALLLAFSNLPPDVDAVVVIDADTLVSPNILRAFAARRDLGAVAVQADYAGLVPRL